MSYELWAIYNFFDDNENIIDHKSISIVAIFVEVPLSIRWEENRTFGKIGIRVISLIGGGK